MEGLLFPKTQKKKKKKKHRRSILHDKEARTCYLCMTLEGNYNQYDKWCLDEHHIFDGPNRRLSEEYGLKVYLCKRHHTGSSGVHENIEIMRYLQKQGQWVFEAEYKNENFRKIFGRSYVD